VVEQVDLLIQLVGQEILQFFQQLHPQVEVEVDII
jgi:hypothetical protein